MRGASAPQPPFPLPMPTVIIQDEYDIFVIS